MSTGPSERPGKLPSAPPEAWEPLHLAARRAVRPLKRFLHVEEASGIVLLVAAAVALAWANSPWAGAYVRLWHTPLGIQIGELAFERTLAWFVSDALMVVFFFVVGMEIRREVHHGELSEWRTAALPVVAAAGGMLGPAALYLLVAGAPELRSGWGVPMATDIAFAVGILALLGKRVPAALRMLLLALAVIDDLGAIIVIALFYSSGIAVAGLLVTGAGIGAIFALRWLGVRSKVAYVAPAVVIWAGIYASGAHPTIAGVIVGFLTPVQAWLGPGGFIVGTRRELDRLALAGTLTPDQLARTLSYVDSAAREALSPAESLIGALHPWVAFGIMPVFALANAGVSFSGLTLDAGGWSVATGITLGLVLGKPAGILLACWISLRVRLVTLPTGLAARHLAILGVVAGVGFTMSIFVAHLAFPEGALLEAAKLGVLAASAAAAVLALVLGRLLLPAPARPPDAA